MSKIFEVPVIETERLRLRGQTPEDFETYLAMWQEAGVVRFTLGRPATREEAWTRFLRTVGHWTFTGFGWWVIEEKASGQFIGEVGLFDFKRDITPPLEGKIEMGWGLVERAARRGFAAEATRAVLQWAAKNLSGRPIYCIINPENAASIRLAAKLGFVETGSTEYKDHRVNIYRRKPGAS